MSSIDTRKQEREKQRKVRVPLGVPRSKLSAPQIQGYSTRWINDTVGRLQNAEAGGYEFVYERELDGQAGNTDLGDKVSRIVGRNEDGSPLRAFLMKIKETWYREDQRTKQRKVDEIDTAIRRGKLNEQPDDKRYVPKEGIKIDQPQRVAEAEE